MNLCIECSKIDKTCCQLGSGVVLLTDKDIQRIEAYTGKTGFHRKEPPKEYLANRIASSFDPNMKTYALSRKGTVQTLKHQENGDCIFLSKEGCELPLETRPLYCRIHPYDFVEDQVTGITFVDCPVQLLENKGSLPDMLGIRYPDADRWVKMLYQELREGRICHENRSDL
jgi:Fe-S-cluster containining protein